MSPGQQPIPAQLPERLSRASPGAHSQPQPQRPSKPPLSYPCTASPVVFRLFSQENQLCSCKPSQPRPRTFLLFSFPWFLNPCEPGLPCSEGMFCPCLHPFLRVFSWIIHPAEAWEGFHPCQVMLWLWLIPARVGPGPNSLESKAQESGIPWMGGFVLPHPGALLPCSAFLARVPVGTGKCPCTPEGFPEFLREHRRAPCQQSNICTIPWQEMLKSM